jgi:hypothetical protein
MRLTEGRTGSLEEQVAIVTRPLVNLHKSPVKSFVELKLDHQSLAAEWGGGGGGGGEIAF